MEAPKAQSNRQNAWKDRMIRPSIVRKSYLTDGEWIAVTHLGHVKRFPDWSQAIAWAVNEYLLTVRTFGEFYGGIFSMATIQ